MQTFDFASEQHNRTCGDHVQVFATVDGSGQVSMSFLGAGCSPCLASASLMMDLTQGQNRSEIKVLLDDFRKMMDQGVAPEAGGIRQALNGVRQYPLQSQCIKRVWQALNTAEDWSQLAAK